jgi:hypothetical protein
MAVGAKHTSMATVRRTLEHARKRTPAAIQADLDRIEAGYVAEAAWRKEIAAVNVPKWVKARKAIGGF